MEMTYEYLMKRISKGIYDQSKIPFTLKHIIFAPDHFVFDLHASKECNDYLVRQYNYGMKNIILNYLIEWRQANQYFIEDCISMIQVEYQRQYDKNMSSDECELVLFQVYYNLVIEDPEHINAADICIACRDFIGTNQV